MFYHKTVNEFDYGVWLHTPLGVIYNTWYVLYIMFLKSEKF